MTFDKETDVRDVRAWLEGVDVPPLRWDVDETVAAGRNRQRLHRRNLRIMTSAVAASIAVLVAVPVAANILNDGAGRRDLGGVRAADSTEPEMTGTPPKASAAATPSISAAQDTSVSGSCTGESLVTPTELASLNISDRTYVDVKAMDPTGRYIVGDTRGKSDNSPAVVLWDDGTPKVISTAWEHLSVTAVNASGVMIGSASTGDGPWKGWVYRDGKVTELALPAGYFEIFYPVGINSAGDIVGTVLPAGMKEARVAVWPADSPDNPRVLVGTGKPITAAGITDDGTVIGWYNGMLGVYQWDASGKGKELPLPKDAEKAYARVVHWPWAVGTADGRPVRWDLRTGLVAELDAPTGRPMSPGVKEWLNETPVDMNAAGDRVYNFPGGALLRNGRWVNLPVASADSGSNPVAISDDGKVIAGSVYTNPDEPGGKRVPARWRC